MSKTPKSEMEKHKEYVVARLSKLSPLLQKYALGDFSENIEIPEKEDEFTELLVSLNLMVDDIKELVKTEVDRTAKLSTGVSKMIDVIQKVARGDYSVQIKLSGENDDIDSLAMGINMMIDDIKYSVKEVERKQEMLQEKIEELEKSEAASLNMMEDLHETMEQLEKMQKIIEKKNIELEKLSSLKSAFLNITSHELRTPMSPIKGYIQMLLKRSLGKINSDQRQVLEIVLRNVDRLDHLVQDILDISRLESGTMKFVPEKTNLQKMINEITETMQSSADLKHIKVNADIEKDLPDLTVDQERIKQVLINLLNNAIKFSSDDSVINVRVKKEGDVVLFEVQDFGRGIPKNKQRKIFETFYQVDSGKDRKFGGVGLGLSISRGIVLAHGGRIWVESTVGRGSTFRFILLLKSVIDAEGKFKEIDMFGLENKELYYIPEIISPSRK